jgi:hypothetical protein
MRKISTVAKSDNEILKEPKLTIGLDLGDRTSHYRILDEAGNVILEHNLPRHRKESSKSSAGLHAVALR